MVWYPLVLSFIDNYEKSMVPFDLRLSYIFPFPGERKFGGEFPNFWKIEEFLKYSLRMFPGNSEPSSPNCIYIPVFLNVPQELLGNIG